MDEHWAPVSATRLILTVGSWVVGLFGLLRLDWVQQRVLLPLGAAQQQIAGDLMGASTTAVVVDISCTGADEMALCVGVIMAFPAAWSARVRGALGGLALVLVLNTVRIGSLSLVADDRAMLDLLHLYVWPAILVVAVLVYVFVWMTRATDAATDANPPTSGAHGSPAFSTALVLAPPLFFGLGIARLLVLALPQAVIASHVTAIHAFSQVLAALAVIAAAAWVRDRTVHARSWATGAVVGFAVGPL
jgi:exosortase/archaeosortase family protein